MNTVENWLPRHRTFVYNGTALLVTVGLVIGWKAIPIHQRRLAAREDSHDANGHKGTRREEPSLEFDNGERLTEGPVIVQWIADQYPAAGLVPPAGKPERYRVQEWLNFITSELHKSFGPVFRPTTPDAYKAISKENLGKRFGWLDKQLAGKHYLMGDKFTVADAYLFTVLRWASRIDMDLGKWPNLKAYVDRVAARPKVQEALKAEGLSK